MASSLTLSPFVHRAAAHVPHPPSSSSAPAGSTSRRNHLVVTAATASTASSASSTSSNSATGSTASLFDVANIQSQDGITPSPYYTHTQMRLTQQPFATAVAAASASSAAAATACSSSASSPSHAGFFYKLVARVGPNRYLSLYDGTTEYILGATVVRPIRALPPIVFEPINGNNNNEHTINNTSSGASTSRSTARSGRSGGGGSGSNTARSSTSSSSSSSGGWKGDESRGGLFVCRTADEATAARIPDVAALFCSPRVLMKCICWGDSVDYGSSTLAFSHLRPVQVFPLSFGYRCTSFGSRLLTNVSLQETRKRLPRFQDPRHQAPVRSSYTQRKEMEQLTKNIKEMDMKINEITRAQLGWRPN